MAFECRVCQFSPCGVWMDFGPQPNSVKLLATSAEPSRTHPLILARCPACGFIFIPDPMPAEEFYGDRQRATSLFPARHLESLVEEVARRNSGRQATRVFEIGCNDGHFLGLLREAGFSAAQGIEPSEGCAQRGRALGFEIETGYFCRGKAEELLAKGIQADLLVCRHVLEHILDLEDFLQGMVLLLAPGGEVLLEFPDLEAMEEKGDFSTVWEQHVNYFDLAVLRRLVRPHGLRIAALRRVPHGGGALIAFLERGDDQEDLPPPPSRDALKEGLTRNLASLHEAMTGLHRQGRKIVAFGAGMRGTMLINLAGIGACLTAVLDDNPEKTGCFLPGSRLPILPTSHLLEASADYCLVLPLNAKETELSLMTRFPGFLEAGGRFLEWLPERGGLLAIHPAGPDVPELGAALAGTLPGGAPQATPGRCHSCGASALEAFPGIEAFVPVSSDIRLVQGRLHLGHCPACGLLQKLTDGPWQASVDAIYASYQINHQGQGSDPYIFRSVYGPGPRAAILATHLATALHLPRTGSMLDIGCANGNLLLRFGQAFPDWSLFGLENSPQWRQAVLGIPGVEGFFNDLEETRGQTFDLIVMSHVLEHIPEPGRYLERLRERLAEGGTLFIAVPDIRQNPIDLLVLDHCSHFDANSLDAVLRRSGFRSASLRSDLLGKELISISHPGAAPGPGEPGGEAPFAMPPAAVVDKYLSLCADLVRYARELRAAYPRFGVMGTSTAAAWVAGELGMAVDFYVEEDPQRIGRTAFDRPILAMAEVPPGACVFIPMSSTTARAIIGRASRNDLALAFLPWNETEDVAMRAELRTGGRTL